MCQACSEKELKHEHPLQQHPLSDEVEALLIECEEAVLAGLRSAEPDAPDLTTCTLSANLGVANQARAVLGSLALFQRNKLDPVQPNKSS